MPPVKKKNREVRLLDPSSDDDNDNDASLQAASIRSGSSTSSSSLYFSSSEEETLGSASSPSGLLKTPTTTHLLRHASNSPPDLLFATQASVTMTENNNSNKDRTKKRKKTTTPRQRHHSNMPSDSLATGGATRSATRPKDSSSIQSNKAGSDAATSKRCYGDLTTIIIDDDNGDESLAKKKPMSHKEKPEAASANARPKGDEKRDCETPTAKMSSSQTMRKSVKASNDDKVNGPSLQSKDSRRISPRGAKAGKATSKRKAALQQKTEHTKSVATKQGSGASNKAKIETETEQSANINTKKRTTAQKEQPSVPQKVVSKASKTKRAQSAPNGTSAATHSVPVPVPATDVAMLADDNKKKPASSKKRTLQDTRTASSTKENKEPVATAKSASESSAPKKKKRKKLSFQDQVLQHMFLSYKPFTLKTLAAELKTTESSLNFLMLSLLDKGIVTKKEFTSPKGRTKELYWANYGVKTKEVAVCLPTQQEMETTERYHKKLSSEVASLNKLLSEITQGPTNQELTEQVKKEEADLVSLRKRLHEMKNRIRDSKTAKKSTSLGGPVKTAAQLAKERCPRRLKIRINRMREEWKKRKEKCVDLIEQLADGMEKKPKDILKLLDLEMDGDVKMPPKHVVE